MDAIYAPLRGLFDALLRPLVGLGPWWLLVGLSLPLTVGVLLVFRRVSNQRRLEAVKRKIHAGLFEIRLFNDDPLAILRAQGEILRQNVAYFALNLVPMLVILPPMLLLFIQLQPYRGYQGFASGDRFLVTATLTGDWEAGVPAGPEGKPRARLEVPAGVEVETASLWIADERTAGRRTRPV